MYLCKFGQKLAIGSEDRVQTMFFTVIWTWWPWKLGQGHQSLIIYCGFPMMYLCQFGQNLAIDSEDWVQTRLSHTGDFEN